MTSMVKYDFTTATVITTKTLLFPIYRLEKNDLEELRLAALATSNNVQLGVNGKSIMVIPESAEQPIPSALANKLSLNIFHLIFSAAAFGFDQIDFRNDVILPDELVQPDPLATGVAVSTLPTSCKAVRSTVSGNVEGPRNESPNSD